MGCQKARSLQTQPGELGERCFQNLLYVNCSDIFTYSDKTTNRVWKYFTGTPKLPLTVQLFTLWSFTHTYSCDKTTGGWLSNSWLLCKARPERVKGIQIRVQGTGQRTEKQHMLWKQSSLWQKIGKRKDSGRDRSLRNENLNKDRKRSIKIIFNGSSLNTD